MTVLRSLATIAVVGWAYLHGQPPGSPAAAIVALVVSVCLEWKAVPSSGGFLSPAPCLALALAGYPPVGMAWTLVCLTCAVGTRVVLSRRSARGRLADWADGFVPAALVAAAVDRWGLAPALPVALVAAVPWAPTAGLRRAWWQERLTMLSFGPIAYFLAQVHGGLMVLLVPGILFVLATVSAREELTARRAQHLNLRTQQKELRFQGQRLDREEERQLHLQRLLDARADAFALLEALSTQPLSERQALEEALKALAERLPGSQCSFLAADEVPPALQRVWTEQKPSLSGYQGGSEAVWPLPQRGLVQILCPQPISQELSQTLAVFFRYLHVMLERVRFQETILVALDTEAGLRRELTVAVTRLHALLAGAGELARLVRPRQILELAVERVACWTGGRGCAAICDGIEVGQAASGWLQFALGPGQLAVEASGLEPAERDALQLWTILIAGALERCRIQATLLQGSKLAAVGQLAAGVAHELNSPLGSISLALGVAAQCLELKPERALSRIELARKAVDQMRSIVAKLLNYSRETGSGLRPTELCQLVKDTVLLVEQGFQADKVGLEARLSEEPLVALVNPGEFQQVLVNLLVNARQATAGRQQPEVVVEVSRSGQSIVLEVSDNGPGVPEEVVDRIFEPFFTTRQVGEGVGLGLSMAREVVLACEGQLSYRPAPSGGARFSVTLPLPHE